MLYLDLETFSEADLKVAGAYKYAAAPTTEVLIAAYAIDDGEATAWDVTTGEPMPDDLRQALSDPSVTVVMHNGAMFDRLVLKHALGVDVPVSRLIDTMVIARSHALPGALSDLCTVLNIPDELSKLAEGSRLVQRFCKPQSERHTVRRCTRETHPAEWSQFVKYAVNDIVAMREVLKRMPQWNYPSSKFERKLFELDQRINDRGFAVDVELASAASSMIQRELDKLDAEVKALTGGEVETTNQLAAMAKHLRNRFSMDVHSLAKANLDELIADPNTPEQAKRILDVRNKANNTSTAKFNRLLQTMDLDGRLRGVMVYCGAARTSRWSSKLFQVQNIARPSRSTEEIEAGIKAIKSGAVEFIEDDPIGLAKDVLRGVIVAPANKKLVVSDLAGIESRVAAWLADEAWKVHGFERFDSGVGYDSYVTAYGQLFGVDPGTVTNDQRKIGKVLELSMAYGGGVGALLNMVKANGLDIEDLAVRAEPSVPADVLKRSQEWYDQLEPERQMLDVISPHAWVVANALKLMWRKAHPRIAGMWQRLEAASSEAFANPDQPIAVGRVTLRRRGAWLTITLPSGRLLCYPGFRLSESGASYMGSASQFGNKWVRIDTYGGKTFEQICQSVARDILAHGMLLAEETGYRVVASVHDELITEVPAGDSTKNARGLSDLMSAVPHWAKGLPLAAEGFEAKRYRK